MGVFKWVGYGIVSTLVVAVLAIVGTAVSAFLAIAGLLLSGVVVIGLVALCLKEYCESKPTDPAEGSEKRESQAKS